MSSVLPWQVVTEVAEGDPRSGTSPRNEWVPGRIEGVVFSPDARSAVMRQLYHRHRIRRKKDRIDISGEMPAAVRLLPLRIRSMSHSSLGLARPVYAASVTAAMALAQGEHGPEGYVDACDDLDVIMKMPEPELWRQACYVWPDDYRRVRVPGLWQRWQVDRKTGTGRYATREIARSVHLSTCLALRLAMLLPWFGAPPGSEHDAGAAIADRRYGLERAHGRHDDNIPKQLVRDMFDRFGERLVPFSAAETALLERFVRAYGHEAQGMTWREIAGLWEAGPEGLTRARLDVGLRIGEMFCHGPEYRP